MYIIIFHFIIGKCDFLYPVGIHRAKYVFRTFSLDNQGLSVYSICVYFDSFLRIHSGYNILNPEGGMGACGKIVRFAAQKCRRKRICV